MFQQILNPTGNLWLTVFASLVPLLALLFMLAVLRMTAWLATIFAGAITMLVGILVSALVGYAAIAWLIRYLQSNSLRVFIIYRIVAGVVVIALAFAMHLQ